MSTVGKFTITGGNSNCENIPCCVQKSYFLLIPTHSILFLLHLLHRATQRSVTSRLQCPYSFSLSHKPLHFQIIKSPFISYQMAQALQLHFVNQQSNFAWYGNISVVTLEFSHLVLTTSSRLTYCVVGTHQLLLMIIM